MTWSRVRRVVQIVSLVTCLALTLAALGWGANWVPGTIFSRIDPLVGLSSLFATKAFATFWAAAIITVVATVMFGRVWCGWICPLGTMVDILPSRRRNGAKRLSTGWQLGKYVVLVLVLAAAAFGSLGPMILDPITIITRPLQELVRPFIGRDAASQNAGLAISLQSVHLVAFLSLIPLIAVLLLNAIDRRFWCRNLCPLGGLLAIVSLSPGSRRQVDSDACISCGRCAKVCPTAAISADDEWRSSATECVACMRCVDECPTSASRYPLKPASEFIPPHMPERRHALIAIGATGVSLAVAMLPKASAEGAILRPPSTSEERLAELCVRCGACYAGCPTGVLRPSLSFTTLAGPWTPMLDHKPAYCTLNCNRCARACPTDALHMPDELPGTVGTGVIAVVHHGLCRAWGRGHECMLCQPACPIAGALTAIQRPNAPHVGGGAQVLVPVVNPDLCIGCNLCAGRCPIEPTAIRVPGSTWPPPQGD